MLSLLFSIFASSFLPFYKFFFQALFGVQFVLSVTMATILQKISPFISLGKWILCNEQWVIICSKYIYGS